MIRRKKDDAARTREDAFLGDLVPQVTEHLAERLSGDFDAVAGQARFEKWLTAHAKEPAVPAPRVRVPAGRLAHPRISRSERLAAIREGLRDGRRGLPMLPLSLAADGSSPPPVSAYQSQLQDMVDEVALRYQDQLFRDNIPLIREIVLASAALAADTRTAADRARLTESLMTWAMRVQAQGALAEAAAARANQQLDLYWASVRRHHAGLRAAVMNLSNWRPAPIQLSEAWGHPLALLSLAFGETSDARQHSQELSRAMKMVDLSEVMRHYP